MKESKEIIRVLEAKDLSVYRRLLKVLGGYSDNFPGTGVGRMFDAALEHGKKILPKDTLAISILDHILKTNSGAAAVSKILNLRLSELPVELRPLIKDGKRKIVAHWAREALVGDKIKDLIDWEGTGKKGHWANTDGEKVKLHDLSQKEE